MEETLIRVQEIASEAVLIGLARIFVGLGTGKGLDKTQGCD